MSGSGVYSLSFLSFAATKKNVCKFFHTFLSVFFWVVDKQIYDNIKFNTKVQAGVEEPCRMISCWSQHALMVQRVQNRRSINVCVCGGGECNYHILVLRLISYTNIWIYAPSNYHSCSALLPCLVLVFFFRFPSRWALERAKMNVEKYLVVGILEEYDDFIKVLEKLLPNFFKGAYNQSKIPGNLICIPF